MSAACCRSPLSAARTRSIEQIRRCREVIGAGVLDLSLTDPGSGDLDALMDALELFGSKVLPRIRDI